MNKIETLPKQITIYGITYSPRVLVTAWNNWCISYVNMVKPTQYFCSVVVEPDNEPVVPNNAHGINERIGNARTFDDAIDMICEYITKF